MEKAEVELVWGQKIRHHHPCRALIFSRYRHLIVILGGSEQRLAASEEVASIFSKLLRFYLNKGSWMKSSLKNYLQRSVTPSYQREDWSPYRFNNLALVVPQGLGRREHRKSTETEYLEKEKGNLCPVLILGILKRQSLQYCKLDIHKDKERNTIYWVPGTNIIPFNSTATQHYR